MDDRMRPNDRKGDRWPEDQHPKLSDEEDAAQRGEDPPGTQPDDHKPTGPSDDPDLAGRRDQVNAFIQGWLKEKGRQRQDGLWPYLLIRSNPGDHGVRPVMPGAPAFWESPDLLVVPGAVDTYDGVSATLSPQPGQPHTIFVRVWNLGRLEAVGVKLRVYWANPSYSFDDPLHPPTLIGSIYLDLPDRTSPNCHQLFRIPAPWVPTWENGGHECLLAKVDCFADGGGTGFDANANRHVGQRNLQLVSGTTDLQPLLKSLSLALPLRADLHLLHGMGDLDPILIAHQPAAVGVIRAPDAAPAIADTAPDGLVHLGAIVRSSPTFMRFMPPDLVSKTAYPTASLATFLTHPQAVPVEAQEPVAETMVRSLGVADFSAASLASLLTRSPSEGHVLRFVASEGGKVIGGYTIIVES